jgi:uncharacterized protein
MTYLSDMIKTLKLLLLTIPVLLLFIPVFGQDKDFPEMPNPPRLVNDYANLLSDSEAESLESKLDTYDDTTSTQIAVVIMPVVPGGYEYSDYAERLAEKWGIGHKGKDNGVLIFVASKEHKIWIATGYGAEPFVPDVTAKLIIENYMVPAFRQGNFAKGLNEGTSALMEALSGQFDPEKRKDKSKKITPLIFLGFFIFIVLWTIIGNLRKGNSYTTFNRGGHFRGTGWGGGGYWGGGGGHSSGGGGFGGFGGGGFGGGGAGGSW